MAALEGPVAVAHLLRRAGFGHSPESWREWAARPYEEVLEALLAPLAEPGPDDPPGFEPYTPGAIQQLWLERMVSGRAPLAEKLTLFWHGHFATSDTKVQDPGLMWQQHRLLRGRGGGRLTELVLESSRDVAMIRWLDGNANRRGDPNENYGRELMELFTLGIGNYSEEDVREVARCFTGWSTRRGQFHFAEEHHDPGEKTVLGQTGNFGGEEVVAQLTASPVCHRFLATKLLRFFSHPEPTTEEVARLAQAFAVPDATLQGVLRALFMDPAFRDESRYRALVKSPVEVAVSALRAAGRRSIPDWVHGSLERMGQILFRPPSVKGWTSGKGWLSSAAVVERLRLGERLSKSATYAASGQIDSVALEGRLDPALAEQLLSLSSRRRVAAVLASPEFQLA